MKKLQRLREAVGALVLLAFASAPQAAVVEVTDVIFGDGLMQYAFAPASESYDVTLTDFGVQSGIISPFSFLTVNITQGSELLGEVYIQPDGSGTESFQVSPLADEELLANVIGMAEDPFGQFHLNVSASLSGAEPVEPTATPLPPAVFLFGGSLIALSAIGRRRRSTG